MDIRSLSLLVLLLPCMTSRKLMSYQENRDADENTKPDYKGLVPARIRMMRRVVRNFQHGASASITLVFHSTRDVYIRWFKKIRGNYGGSEVPGFYPLEGDPKMRTQTLVADDVIATTLRINRYVARYPDSFEVIITAKDGSVQYNLKTDIEHDILRPQIDKIDSPEWDILPQDVTFEPDGECQVVCQAFVYKELSKDADNVFNDFNQLFMNRFKGKLDIDADVNNIIKVHQGMDHISQQEGDNPLIISGFWEPTKYDHVIYEAKMYTSNASANSDTEGIYQCVMERTDQQGYPFEKSFANSLVRMTGNESPYVESMTKYHNNGVRVQKKTVRIILKPCQENMYENIDTHNQKTLKLRNGQKSCFRCIAMGDPKPRISLFKDRERVNTRTDIVAVESINVADGGLVETTYIIRNPSEELGGKYKCEGRNTGGRAALNFEVKIVN